MSEQQRSIMGELTSCSPVVGSMQCAGTVHGSLFLPPRYKNVRTFDTVADMQAARDLTDGAVCHTLGFYEVGDGGASFYQIASDGEPNGMDVISCGDMNAVFVKCDTANVNPHQFGYDGTNLGAVCNRLIMRFGTIQFLPKTYTLTDEPIVLNNLTSIKMTETTIVDFTTETCFSSVDTVHHARIDGGYIRNISGNRQNIGVYLDQARNCIVENLYIRNTDKAIVIDGKSTWAATNTIFNVHCIFFNVGIHLTANAGKQCNNTVIMSSYLIDNYSSSTATAFLLDASGDTNKAFGLAVEDCNIGYSIQSTSSSTPMALFGCRAENCTTKLTNTSGASNIIVFGCNFTPSFSAPYNQNVELNDLNGKYLKKGEYIKFYDSGNTLRNLLYLDADANTVYLKPSGKSKKVIIGGTDSSQNLANVVQIDNTEGFKVLKPAIRLKSSTSGSSKYFDIKVDDNGNITATQV